MTKKNENILTPEDTAWHKGYEKEWSEDLQRTYDEFNKQIQIWGLSDSRVSAMEGSISLAQMALKSLLMINGGALLAITILIDLEISKEQILFSSYCFVSGLISVMFAILFSYFSLSNASLGNSYGIYHRYCQHMALFHQLRKETGLEKHHNDNIKTYSELEVKSDQKVRKHESAAIILGIISLLCFSVGAVSICFTS